MTTAIRRVRPTAQNATAQAGRAPHRTAAALVKMHHLHMTMGVVLVLNAITCAPQVLALRPLTPPSHPPRQGARVTPAWSTKSNVARVQRPRPPTHTAAELHTQGMVVGMACARTAPPPVRTNLRHTPPPPTRWRLRWIPTTVAPVLVHTATFRLYPTATVTTPPVYPRRRRRRRRHHPPHRRHGACPCRSSGRA